MLSPLSIRLSLKRTLSLLRFHSTKTDFGFKEVDKDEKERLVKNVFSSVASKYDVMNDFMSVGVHRLWKDEFVSMMGLKASANTDPHYVPRLLDVAGGTGKDAH
jgi:2-methoxy-6-polyprenyl-1,4-benzoquinol methylase